MIDVHPDADGRRTDRGLRRPKRSAWAITIAVAVAGVVGATAAFADVSASDGGSTVTVTASTSTSVPGSSGTSTGSPGASSGPSCTWTGITSPTPYGGITVSGSSADGPWYLLACPGSSAGVAGSGLVWVPGGSPSPPASTSIAPSQVGEKAEGDIQLPSPTIAMNPSDFSVVGLATWLWIDPSVWHPYAASASAGGLTATATATPVSVRWDMGDGAPPITCDGPGTPYDDATPSDEQHTNCAFTYARSSAGQPSPDGNPDDASFLVTATITWEISWTSSVHDGGGLAPLETRATRTLRVEQVQSVDSLQ